MTFPARWRDHGKLEFVLDEVVEDRKQLLVVQHGLIAVVSRYRTMLGMPQTLLRPFERSTQRVRVYARRSGSNRYNPANWAS